MSINTVSLGNEILLSPAQFIHISSYILSSPFLSYKARYYLGFHDYSNSGDAHTTDEAAEVKRGEQTKLA